MPKVKAMPKRLKTGAEFLGASAKAASSSRGTFVNTSAFEVDDEDVAIVRGGGACMEVDDDGADGDDGDDGDDGGWWLRPFLVIPSTSNGCRWSQAFEIKERHLVKEATSVASSSVSGGALPPVAQGEG